MDPMLYEEQSKNPFASPVTLTGGFLRQGGRTTPPSELNLGAMAASFIRGRWLGGVGTERPLEELSQGGGIVPVTRYSGTTRPLRVRRAADFAHALGGLAVHRSGGADRVAALADRAEADGVPLWIARRFAMGPAGWITVAVDRRLARVDVWGPHAPAVRLRAPHGYDRRSDAPGRGLIMTIGDAIPLLVLRAGSMFGRGGTVEVRLPDRRWVLHREEARSSWLSRDDRRVALLTRPPRSPSPTGALLPLTTVQHEGPDPLDAVVAHALGTAMGLGRTTGQARFRTGSRTRDDIELESEGLWDQAWYSNLGTSGEDNDSSDGDGWGAEGGDGGDGGDGGE